MKTVHGLLVSKKLANGAVHILLSKLFVTYMFTTQTYRKSLVTDSL
jgi:hypothetical protein